MATFVSPHWVEDHILHPDQNAGPPPYLLVDPRSAMRYLMGHLPGAVSVPLKKLQDARGRLLPPDQIAAAFANAGLGDNITPVLYDGQDGRNAAMHAWILEYLGRTDVHILDLLFDPWKAQGRPVLYRPVAPTPRTFTPSVNPQIRASLADAASPAGAILLDTRTIEEYRGEAEMDHRPGHIPGARHLPWTQLAGPDGRLPASPQHIDTVMASAGITRNHQVIAYCRSGLRAALPWLAMTQAGYNVRLYDGSYAEWMDSPHPTET